MPSYSIQEILYIIIRNVLLKSKFTECELGAVNFSYLGYRLTPEGILPGSDKLKLMRDTKPPSKVQ
jgi:hypothetical protein